MKRKIVHIHKINITKKIKLELSFYETAINIIPTIEIGWGGKVKEIPFKFAIGFDWLMFSISIWFQRKSHGNNAHS